MCGGGGGGGGEPGLNSGLWTGLDSGLDWSERVFKLDLLFHSENLSSLPIATLEEPEGIFICTCVG